MSGFLRDAAKGLSTLFFPHTCPFCHGENGCVAIGGRRCLDYWVDPPSIRYIGKVPIYSVLPYDDMAMNVVLAAKERGEKRARELLSIAINSVITMRLKGSSPLVVIPIPSTMGAIRKRGEDFILTLVRSISRDVHDREVLVAPVLRWRRNIEDQSLLSLQDRERNLASACEVDEEKVKKWLASTRIPSDIRLEIALIDDVITSGATLTAAISAISHSSLGSRSSLVGITACHSARGF